MTSIVEGSEVAFSSAMDAFNHSTFLFYEIFDSVRTQSNVPPLLWPRQIRFIPVGALFPQANGGRDVVGPSDSLR